ncbi:DUF5716 family protein [Anaeromicropila herbilytica]|uniref:DUF5716 domain-containing protein n=1 Tax=Anaeromicropila herbilytica TaxID=2785025 RepID=A0A7R7EJV1_9FIRM|nr:DUF5716 family protein [Anaeromicropila herbilytica]BCN30020.1 hypothetical protein bsdtb5_13150 [Anaeromicropila herbilytica]
MSEERNLIVGFDLCDDYSQISCFNMKTFEPESICYEGEEDECLIPTILAVRKNSYDWYYGKEAIQLVRKEEAIKIDHILKQLREKKEIMIGDTKLDGVSLLEKFFRKSLSLLKLKYPNQTIDQLVITVEKLEKNIIKSIYKALEGLSIMRDRVYIQCHQDSFAYYTLYQSKELFMNDVGVFDFSKAGLSYYQLKIDRKKEKQIVTIAKKDCSDILSYEMIERQNDMESLNYIFQNVAKNILYKQVVSTLFFTGVGFEEQWADEVMKQLGVGRRIFKGQNLYAKGACYAARSNKEPDRLKDYLILTEEMITSSISILAYYDAKVSEILLAKIATPWYEVKEQFYLVLDDKEEIELIIKDRNKSDPTVVMMNLDGIANRPKRMTKVYVTVRFLDKYTCVIQVKDEGFGEFYPSTNRIWEKTINLA